MNVIGPKFGNSDLSRVKSAVCDLQQTLHRLDRQGWAHILSPALLGIADGGGDLKASEWSYTITSDFKVVVTVHDLQEQGPNSDGGVAWRKRGDCKFQFTASESTDPTVLLWPPKFGCGVEFMYQGERFRCVRFHEDNQMVYECRDAKGQERVFLGEDEPMMVHI